MVIIFIIFLSPHFVQSLDNIVIHCLGLFLSLSSLQSSVFRDSLMFHQLSLLKALFNEPFCHHGHHQLKFFKCWILRNHHYHFLGFNTFLLLCTV